MTVVVGIDPGLASLGWGVLSYQDNSRGDMGNIRHHAHGVINTRASASLPMRLLEIEQKFDQVLSRYRPTALGYERQFFVKNVTSGLEVAHALGVILLYCAKNNIHTRAFTPQDIKKQITGNARAKKESVEKFMCMQLRMDTITSHHASDAVAIALVTCYAMQQQLALTAAGKASAFFLNDGLNRRSNGSLPARRALQRIIKNTRRTHTPSAVKSARET